MIKFREKTMKAVFILSATVSIIAVALICVFLFANGIPAMREIGFAEFLTGRSWKPEKNIFGILATLKSANLRPKKICFHKICAH